MLDLYKITMARLLIILFVLSPFVAIAGETNDVFVEHTKYVMADILCNTSVIKDMGMEYGSLKTKLKIAKNNQEKNEIKIQLGKSLRKAWLNQKYDLKPYPKIVSFMNFLIKKNAPMEVKLEYATLWSEYAQKKCPIIACAQCTTTQTAMTLISVIAD